MCYAFFLLLLALIARSSGQSPSPCRSFRPSFVSDSQASLEWNEPTTGTPSTGYLIHCKTIAATTWTRLAGRRFFNQEVEYTNLNPNVDYVCRCRAWSNGETMPKSSPVYTMFTTALPDTARSGLPGNPVGLTATWWSDTEVRFEWSPPVDGGLASGYSVWYRSSAVPGQWPEWVVLAHVTAPQVETSVVISGVTPGWFVQIRVWSVNVEGASNNGAWELGFTDLTPPTPSPTTAAPTPLPTPAPTPSLECQSIQVDGPACRLVISRASDSFMSNVSNWGSGNEPGSIYRSGSYGTYDMLTLTGVDENMDACYDIRLLSDRVASTFPVTTGWNWLTLEVAIVDSLGQEVRSTSGGTSVNNANLVAVTTACIEAGVFTGPFALRVHRYSSRIATSTNSGQDLPDAGALVQLRSLTNPIIPVTTTLASGTISEPFTVTTKPFSTTSLFSTGVVNGGGSPRLGLFDDRHLVFVGNPPDGATSLTCTTTMSRYEYYFQLSCDLTTFARGGRGGSISVTDATRDGICTVTTDATNAFAALVMLRFPVGVDTTDLTIEYQCNWS